jgi:hypothetical protein
MGFEVIVQMEHNLVFKMADGAYAIWLLSVSHLHIIKLLSHLPCIRHIGNPSTSEHKILVIFPDTLQMLPPPSELLFS